MTVLTAGTANPEHLYSVEYDIDSSDILCAGKIVLTKDMQLVLYADGKTESREEFRYNFNEIKELFINSHIGCASLEADLKNGDKIRICRFTQSCLNQVSEFIKAANYYIETGEYTEINIERTVCPKCGKHFIVNTQICPNCSNKASIVGKFLSLGKKYIPAFALSGVLVLLCNVINLIIPQINRVLVDDYLFPASEGLEPWGDKNPVLMILILILIMLACYVLIRVINIAAARMRNGTSAAFINSVRIKLYDKIQVLSMSSISRRTTGDLIKRVTEDTSVITEFIKSETVWMIEIGVIFIGVSAYFIATRPLLALFVFIPVPLVLFAASRFWGFINRRYEKLWRLSSTANGILHDIIRGIRVVKVFGTEKKEIEKFSEANRKLAETSQKNEQLWALLFPLLGFLVGIGEFLVLYFGAQSVLNGINPELGHSIIGEPLTLGELTQIMSYIGYIYGPLRWMTSLPRSIANAVTSMAKLNEILDEEPDIRDKADAVTPEIEGNISFVNATFGYKSYEPVLKNITLDIKKGEMVGIVGHSGVGKSTMINLIMRLYDLNSGKLLIDGVDIKDISKETLCRSIGTVFQETFLFAGSIYDNIVYAKPEATPEEVFAAAKIANAHEFIIKLPDAYNTVVGENGYSLSGGERQRVAIARAILRDPKILILDEATASLDTETESKIQEALQRLIKGRTTIAIAHRLSTLRHADRLIVLEKGKLAEQGSHEELLKNKGIYYNLVMAQRQTTKMAEVKQ
ncbi:MAG: ABC transporter ATP-binding protein [Clostridia bacterium]|nr:ABC transporter ATP-binding protein [Clostridia bacterium]